MHTITITVQYSTQDFACSFKKEEQQEKEQTLSGGLFTLTKAPVEGRNVRNKCFAITLCDFSVRILTYSQLYRFDKTETYLAKETLDGSYLLIL